MACTYIHENIEYSRSDILKEIKHSKLWIPASTELLEAVEWLKSKGIKESEIEIVNGLINDEALGLFTKSGKIILSTYSEGRTAYHEAFHYVWNKSQSMETKNMVLETIKSLPNYQDILDAYKEDYNDRYNNDDAYIEEMLADAFESYIVNERTQYDSLETSFMDLKDFTSRVTIMTEDLTGLNPIYANEISRQLINAGLEGDFQLDREMTKLVIDTSQGRTEVTPSEVNEVLKTIENLAIKNVITRDGFSLYSLLNGDTQFNIIKEINRVLGDKYDDNVGRYTTLDKFIRYNVLGDRTRAEKIKLIAEGIKGQLTDVNSPIYKKFKNNYASLGITFSTPANVKESSDINDTNEAKNEAGESHNADFLDREEDPFDKIALQFNRMTSMSSAFKLLMKGVTVSKQGANFGMPTAANYKTSVSTLFHYLADTKPDPISVLNKLEDKRLQIKDGKEPNPQKWEFLESFMDLIYKRQTVGTNISYVLPDASDLLNGDRHRLILEFTSIVTNSKFNFNILRLKDGKPIIHDANLSTTKDKIRKDLASSVKLLLRKYQSRPGFDNDEGFEKYQDDLLYYSSKAGVSSVVGRQQLLHLLGINNAEELLADTIKGEDAHAYVRDKLAPVINRSASYLTMDNVEHIYDKDRNPLRASGAFDNIAETLIKYTDYNDLSLYNAEGDKLFALNLNTHNTLLFNELNQIIRDNKTPEARRKAINEQLPQLLDVYTTHSKWLQDAIDIGKPIKLLIDNGLKSTTNNKSSSTKGLNETDLLLSYFNNVVNGLYPTAKHSDRGLYFSYDAGTVLAFDPDGEVSGVRVQAEELLEGYLADELFLLANIENYQQVDLLYSGKNKNKLAFFGEQTYYDDNMIKHIRNLFTQEQINEMIEFAKDFENPRLFKSQLTKKFKDQIKEGIGKLMDLRIDELANGIEYYTGEKVNQPEKLKIISEEMWELHENPSNEYWNTFVALNTLLGRIEESKLVFGHPLLYKNGDDLFKRLSAISGSGTPLLTGSFVEELEDAHAVRDSETMANARELSEEDFDEFFEDFNYMKTPAKEKYRGQMSSITHAEKEYKVSQSTLREIHTMVHKSLLLTAHTLESELASKSKEQIKGIIERKIRIFSQVGKSNSPARRASRDYLEPLQEIDEPTVGQIVKAFNDFKAAYYTNYYELSNEDDGGSTINMFAFKNMKLKVGEWNDQLQEMFDRELRMLPYLHMQRGTKRDKIFAEIWGLDPEKSTEEDVKKWIKTEWESATTLKPQYSGPTYYYGKDKYVETDAAQRLNTNTISKTSFRVLLPSQVVDTKLKDLLIYMLEYGVDIEHARSARKYGGKRVMKDGEAQFLEFYDEYGNINVDEFEEYSDLDSDNHAIEWLDDKYMKIQVKIAPKEKGYVKQSTQGRKIAFSGLFHRGIPVDYINPHRGQENINEILNEWENLSEDKRKAVSPIYKDIVAYKDIQTNIINQSIANLKREIGVTNDGRYKDGLKKLTERLASMALQRGAATNIIRTFEMFGDIKDEVTAYLELLPNSNKIEPMLYSLITKNVINEKRKGDNQAQVSVLGFEDSKYNRLTEFVDEKGQKYSEVAASDYLQWYRIDPDAEVSNITEAEFAKLIEDGIVEMECIAQDGLSTGLSKGGNWSVIEQFKGKSHARGGIDIRIRNGSITKMKRGDTDYKAQYGLFIPNGNDPQVGQEEINSSDVYYGGMLPVADVKASRTPLLPIVPRLKDGEKCTTKNCSEYTTTAYANITGQSREDVSEYTAHDAWYKRDKVIKSGGSLVWDVNSDFDYYDKVQMGDFVSLSNEGRSYLQPRKGQASPDGYAQEDYARHSGIIVGKNEQGVPIVRHNYIGKIYEEPINDIKKRSWYKPISIFRAKDADTAINLNLESVRRMEAQYEVLNNPTPTTVQPKDKAVNAFFNLYKKNRKDLAYNYAMRYDELDTAFENLMGIAQQESNIDNLKSSDTGDYLKQAVTDNIPSTLNTNLKVISNIPANIKDAVNSLTGNLSPVPNWKKQIEVDQLVEGGKSKEEAIAEINEKYGETVSADPITAKSKGPFKQKAPSQHWLKYYGGEEYNVVQALQRKNWGKEWDDNNEKFLENAFGLYSENKNRARQLYPGETEEFYNKIAILAHNAPGKAFNEEFVNYYIRQINNNSGSTSDYLDNVFKYRKELFNEKSKKKNP